MDNHRVLTKIFEDIEVGMIWEELLNISKVLCSIYFILKDQKDVIT